MKARENQKKEETDSRFCLKLKKKNLGVTRYITIDAKIFLFVLFFLLIQYFSVIKHLAKKEIV